MSSQEPQFSKRAENLKREGNAAFARGDWAKAFMSYTIAISEETDASPSLYANRSAASTKLGHPKHALKDAQRAVEVILW